MKTAPTLDHLEGAKESWGGRHPFVTALACVGAFSVHLPFGHVAFTYTARAYAGALAALATFALLHIERRRLPVIPGALATLYVFFGRPVFARPVLTNPYGHAFPLSSRGLEDACLGSLLAGVTVYIVGQLMSRTSERMSGPFQRFFPVWMPSQAQSVALRCYASVGCVAYAVTTLATFSIPLALRAPLQSFAEPFLPLTLLYVDQRGSDRRAARMWYWGFLAALVSVGMATGRLSIALVPLACAAALLWLDTGRMPIRLVVAGVVAFLVLNPAKHYFRALTWQGDSRWTSETTVGDRVSAWGDAITSTWGESAEVEDSLEQADSRLSSLAYVGQTMDTVPKLVPHTGPWRWLAIPTFWVPRILWPDKPMSTETFHHRYALAFGLQTTAGARYTTITFPLVSDGYWALGWSGVVVAAALVGLLWGVQQGLLAASNPMTAGLGIQLLSRMRAQGDVGSAYLGVPQQIFTTLVILWALTILAGLLEVRAKTGQRHARSTPLDGLERGQGAAGPTFVRRA